MYLLWLGIMMVSVVIGFVGWMGSLGMLLVWEVMNVGGLEWSMVLYFDCISILFMSFMLMISFMVLIYSSKYMGEGKEWFFGLVFLFVFSMVLVISSPSMMSIILGWDGLGVVSYFLVVFYGGTSVDYSGMITYLSNRIGDVVLFMVMGWLVVMGSWNFMWWGEGCSWLCFLVVVVSMTKSAQLPFSAWLPEAMAAPTPVSALVHSSTLVTSGIYLMMRYSGLLIYGSGVVFIGLGTMIFSGLMAMGEMDSKKVIAFSTLSQLGMMMMSLGLGLKILVFFHLLVHAVFKSLMFLSMGVVIGGLGGEQDVRWMGGQMQVMPLVGVIFNVSILSLIGFPFLSGFYSKDYMIEWVWSSVSGGVMELMVVMGLALTAGYGLRLWYKVWVGSYKGVVMGVVVFSWLYMIVLSILCLMVVVAGAWVSVILCYDYVMVSIMEKMVPFLGMMIGVGLISLFSDKSSSVLSGLWNISGYGISGSFMKLSKMMMVLEDGWLMCQGNFGGGLVRKVTELGVIYFGVNLKYMMLLFFFMMLFYMVMFV
uniref:NADH-ubiquinone oxidoreductase chain 5 n=1 Tax=Armillifer agkistrodontis TaxID=592791 RepID=A0A1J0CYI2_ARMAG|nr:NADH dehydrogenase subunit 5 [Armillifer agkistrodontis]APB92072.1 NADH dehydrogenase subunit 5 [Armillifer agkistrodontis]